MARPGRRSTARTTVAALVHAATASDRIASAPRAASRRSGAMTAMAARHATTIKRRNAATALSSRSIAKRSMRPSARSGRETIAPSFRSAVPSCARAPFNHVNAVAIACNANATALPNRSHSHERPRSKTRPTHVRAEPIRDANRTTTSTASAKIAFSNATAMRIARAATEKSKESGCHSHLASTPIRLNRFWITRRASQTPRSNAATRLVHAGPSWRAICCKPRASARPRLPSRSKSRSSGHTTSAPRKLTRFTKRIHAARRTALR